jgi:hypothetical protein
MKIVLDGGREFGELYPRAAAWEFVENLRGVVAEDVGVGVHVAGFIGECDGVGDREGVGECGKC